MDNRSIIYLLEFGRYELNRYLLLWFDLFSVLILKGDVDSFYDFRVLTQFCLDSIFYFAGRDCLERCSRSFRQRAFRSFNRNPDASDCIRERLGRIFEFRILLYDFFRFCRHLGVRVCFFSILPFFIVFCSVRVLFVFQSDHDKSGEVTSFVLAAVGRHVALELLDITVTVLVVNSQILALDPFAAYLDSHSLLRCDPLAVLSEGNIYGHRFIDILVPRDEVRNNSFRFVCAYLVNVKLDAFRKCSLRRFDLNVNIAGFALQFDRRVFRFFLILFHLSRRFCACRLIDRFFRFRLLGFCLLLCLRLLRCRLFCRCRRLCRWFWCRCRLLRLFLGRCRLLSLLRRRLFRLFLGWCRLLLCRGGLIAAALVSECIH